MADLYLVVAVLLIPLFAIVFYPLFSKKNNTWAGVFFCVIVFINFLISLLLFINHHQISVKIYHFDWFTLSNMKFLFSILLDHYTYKMLVLVNFISLLVGIFSIEYMRQDLAKERYFAFIGLFLFSMIGVIISGNLFQMYFFWELVGFSSYLLIGFWYKKPEAVAAAKKAFIMNRIGDVCFLIGIFMCVYQFGSSQIDGLKLIGNQQYLTTMGLLLFGGCIAKSAQFPLHTWLPDAMEGPTPVSALIHAATMVAAGIYLIIRISPIFTETTLIVITTIGCISMIMAGIKAILQSDIKKVLAYSTISQLGLMVVAVGGAAPNYAFNHLITHAFFKAGLFLTAGSIINAIHNSNPQIDAQNLYLMGGLRKKLPVTFYCYLACAAAMVGLPLFSGFVTKDQIIEIWQHKSGIFSQMIFISLLLSSFISAIYRSRHASLIFGGKPNGNEQSTINEKSKLILVPIIILALSSTIFIAPIFEIDIPKIGTVAIINTIIVFVGIVITFILKNKLIQFKPYVSKVDLYYNIFIGQKSLVLADKISFFDDEIFDGTTKLIYKISLILAQIVGWFDTNILDGLVNFIANFAKKIGKSFTKLQSGQFQWYISAMMLLLLLIFILTNSLEKV